MKRLIFFIVFAALGFVMNAQNITVTGTVTDEQGLSVPGAFVLEQGTTNGTSTDIDGNYSIDVPADAVLSFSYMGYNQQDVPVNGRARIDISLVPDTQYLEEVVVVGYGVQKSKDLTAPIETVKGSELSSQIASNPMAALQGKVAGVQIINSGAPGAGPAVKIRGTGSIGEYANPLYVVDGVFVENLDFVSPGDIQEMTVLKDASAAAIYGVRAANGVVLITTKRGMVDQTDISYDGYVGIQVPVNVMKLANREQYVELLNEANADVTGYEPVSVEDYPASTDWYRTLLRNAITHNHSLNISGATEKTNYSFGVGYFNQDGILNADNDYNRINIRARIDQKVTSWLQVGANALVSRYNKQNPNSDSFFQAFVNPPVYGIYNEANEDAYPVKYDSPQLYGFSNSYANPYAQANYYNSKEDGLNLVFSTFVELKFLKDKLKFRSSYNLDYQAYKSQSYSLEYYVGGSQGLNTSSLSKTFGIRDKHIIDNTLTYADNIGKHSFSAMLGQSTRIERFSGMTGSGIEVPDYDDQSIYIGNGSSNDRNVNDLNPSPYRYHGLSFFARGTYNYADRYLATVTFRADGSSKYNKKWGYFPSVGLGWVMTEENFMSSQNVVDYLKIRGSWGMLGNDNVPANSVVITGSAGVGNSAVFGDQMVDGMGAQTVTQNFLEWEVVDELDFGVDFAFLGSRLSGTLDYYNRTTRNVVFYVPIATGGGTAELLSNNGTVRNSGIEFSLGWSDTVGEDFSYNIGLNLTTIDNKVMELKGRDYIPGALVRGNYTTRTMVGYPIGSFWGYEIDGVYASEGEALRDPVSQTIKDEGYFKYTNQDGNDVIDDNDKVYLGSPIPKLIGGLDFSFTWKNLDFNIAFQGQFGNKVLNAKRMNRDVFPDGNYDLDFYENAWRPDRHSNTYPSAEAYNDGYTQQANEFFVEDASYIRIQNVQIGYTFKNLKFIKSLRISLAAQRPYTFFTYNGFTPEISGSPISSGIDTSTYPMSAIYTFGLKLNF